MIVRNTNTILRVVDAVNTAAALPSAFKAVGHLLTEASDSGRCAAVSPTSITAAAAVALASSAETIGPLLAEAGGSYCRCLRTSVTKFDDSGLRA